MNIRIFDNTADLAQATARLLLQRNPTVIGISGGSTPRPLYELLAHVHWPELTSRPITWVLVDERYVPRTDPQSNSAMIRSTLFQHGIPESHTFLDFDTAHADPEDSAREFEQRWHDHGLTALDVILLGVGEDGHTASLFPGTDVLAVDDRVAAAVYVPRLEQWRVTLTMPVIRQAALRIVQAGESKAAILREVAAGADHPVAQATTSEVGETWWMTIRSEALRSDRDAPP